MATSTDSPQDIATKVLSDPTADLQTGAAHIAKAVQESSEKESALSRLWAAIEKWAPFGNNPSERAVELLKCLASQPPALDESGSQIQVYDRRLWEDLPAFGMNMREALDSRQVHLRRGGEGHLANSPEFAPAAANYCALHEFLARCTATGVGALNFELFGLWCLRESLEHQHENDPAESAALKLRYYVPGAAQWISQCGAKLYASQEEYAKKPQGGAPGRGGPLWKGRDGFSKERWELWKTRFEEVAEGAVADEETRSMARQAAERMREIEEGS